MLNYNFERENKMSVRSKIKNIFREFILMCKEEKTIPIIIPTDKNRLLDGKIALITGGTSGIGLSIAKTFIDSGAKVIIAGTKEEKLKDVILNLKNNNYENNIKGFIIDVRDIKNLPERIKAAMELYPEHRIDILVNSAGVVVEHDFWDIDEYEYDNIMDINAKGTFFMSQLVGKMMIEKNVKGHILNITSSSALRPAWTPYQMSKWALRGFTMGLADLLIPYGIVVNAIAPGPTATPMLKKSERDNIFEANNPSRRYALPDEIASLALYMVSGAGDMIVGDTFYMTGGSGTITMHH